MPEKLEAKDQVVVTRLSKTNGTNFKKTYMDVHVGHGEGSHQGDLIRESPRGREEKG